MKSVIFSQEEMEKLIGGNMSMFIRPIKGLPERTYRIEVDFECDGNKTLYAIYGERMPNGYAECADEIQIPYRIGDIVPVREKWKRDGSGYKYAADYPNEKGYSSAGIMPKAATRYWIKINDIIVGRTDAVDLLTAKKTGYRGISELNDAYNRRLKKADLFKYQWTENPFIWMIEVALATAPVEV